MWENINCGDFINCGRFSSLLWVVLNAISFLISFEIRKIGICRREGGDMYNGDADAEDPVDGSKKRKKKVTKCLTLAHNSMSLS